MIRNTTVACQRSGMPIYHACCFQKVANESQCMIASRAVGKWATSLIKDNYSSKGFHIKTKSCNWGPMAGFVLVDPRFSKKGKKGIESQRKATAKAFSHGATQINLYISTQRLIELERDMRCIKTIRVLNDDLRYYSASTPKGDIMMKFALLRKQPEQIPGGSEGPKWMVCYHPDEIPLQQSIEQLAKRSKIKSPYTPIQVLCNPIDPRNPNPLKKTFRRAITGDYDLWGIWPRATLEEPQAASTGMKYRKRAELYAPKKASNVPSIPKHSKGIVAFSPKGIDRRPVPNSDHVIQSYKTFERFEDAHLGNITARGIFLKNRLNDAFRASGYTGGMMVHHSDETGRPQVFEVEMDFIAFIPGQDGRARFVSNMTEYRELIQECIKIYAVSLNGAWQKQLTFGVSKYGAYEF